MVINAQGGKLLESKTTDLQLALDYRLQVSRIYNPGSWYYSYKQQQDLSKVDIGLLESVRSIKLLFSGQIKTRVEEPKIQFYASSESVLKLIAQELDNSICIESVTGPDSNAEQLLESGVIISKNPVDYDYKFIIRDGRYSQESKQQLLAYLDSLDSVVRITPWCKDMLNRPYPSLWSVYFYSKDPDIATFISLIDPRLISNIHKIVFIDQ